MKWNSNTVKRYMEAGLAVLIAFILGLAGSAGVLSPRAAENERTRAAVADDSTKAGEENENKTSSSEIKILVTFDVSFATSVGFSLISVLLVKSIIVPLLYL